MTVRMRNWLRFIVAFLLITIFLIIVMNKFIMPSYVGHGKEVIMPNVCDRLLAEADAILRIGGFAVDVIDTVENFELPSWTVIDQQPPPGKSVKEGRVVRLVVTASEFYFQMPNLVGKVLKAAKIELDHLKLPIDLVEYRFSPDKPEEVVSWQSIEPGFMVCVNTPISLTVSKGSPPKQLEVPDLFALNLEKAKRLIQKSGFKLGTIREIPNNDLAPYTVIGQSPEAGVRKDKPVSIDLEVTISVISETIE